MHTIRIIYFFYASFVRTKHNTILIYIYFICMLVKAIKIGATGVPKKIDCEKGKKKLPFVDMCVCV